MANKKQILAIISLSALMTQTGLPIFDLLGTPQARAQGPAMPGDGASSGPIDIVANEQEFAGDHVIARGNVRVLFKDSVIVAPIATLYRDPATGQPQRAIFTGHPRLTQGPNKIDADTLTFEMASSRIIAEGHSHSEVINEAAGSGDAPAPATAAATTGGPVKWPGAPDSQAPIKAGNPKAAAAAKEKEKLAQAAKAKADTDTVDGDEFDGDGQKIASAPAATSAKPAAKSGMDSEQGPTKIITDADRQEYDRQSGKFEAFGNVKVKAGDINVLSDSLHMAYGLDTKPEAAIFKGHVNATQGQNNTQADNMTYFLNTKRLQATGHVRSKVIQTGQAKAGSKPEAPKPQVDNVEPLVNSQSGQISNLVNGADNQVQPEAQQAPIIIVSDSQDYNKDTGRLDATGSVKIFYQDTVGIGPKVVLLRNADGQAEKIYFIGRSQITQPGKRWIADKIVMTVNDRKVLAEGNTKAFLLQKRPGAPSHIPASNFQLANKKPAQTAARPGSNQQVSTTRVEFTQ